MTSLTLEQQAYDMSLIARIDGLRRAASRFPISLLEFGMRLAVGATFFRSGMNKAEDFSNAIVLFRDEYRLPLLPPEIAAYMGTTVELTAPVLLVLGVFARLGAAALLFMTLTIQFRELAGASDVGLDPRLCTEPRARCIVDRSHRRPSTVRPRVTQETPSWPGRTSSSSARALAG